MSNVKPISVKILSKEFQVSCPAGSEEQLFEVAHHLDQKMREIRKSGRVIGIERIAIMAALNLGHELLMFRKEKEEYVRSVNQTIESLQNKIDRALDDSNNSVEKVVSETDLLETEDF